MYLKYLYVILFLLCIGCNTKRNTFKLNPVPGEVYNYSITKTSSQEWTYQNVAHKTFDTLQLDIGLQGMKNNGDTITCKLMFNNLKIIPRPNEVTFIYLNPLMKINPYNPFVIDSICYLLQGLSVQVDITADGNITEVHGIDDLATNISNTSKVEVNIIKKMLADYVSVNAVKDLLNRILSIPRDKEVKISDSWIKSITLMTKAPVKFSNMYTLKKITGDTAYVEIQSIVSTATTSAGDNVYLKGKHEGEAILSYTTGMPYKYDTKLESVTTTTVYDVIYNEHFTVKRSSSVPQ